MQIMEVENEDQKNWCKKALNQIKVLNRERVNKEKEQLDKKKCTNQVVTKL